jgi:glucose/arabinose dehydrogenase
LGLTLCLVTSVQCSSSSSPPSASGSPQPSSGIHLQLVAGGLSEPVHLTSPPADPRLFIVEQRGTIRIFEDGRLLPDPFLDISAKVRSGGEQGLLSVAFHPSYASNGFFYVNYTDRSGDTRVERYSVSADRNRAIAGSALQILFVEQPYDNHNGGHVLFGPDGMLWIGMGDGGSGNDPHGNGQNPHVLLGKLLRLDVNGGVPYTIPPDNPFADGRNGRPEVWATGLRNPWRLAFDRAENRLYIADVGQNRWEEVHVVAADAPGLNLGWNIMEGNHCLRASCLPVGVPATLEYDHNDGCSITGGIVYRGSQIPGIAGHYFFSDYCSGWIDSFRHESGNATQWRRWQLPERLPVSSFGEDSAGEMYVVSHDGRVFKVVPAS